MQAFDPLERFVVNAQMIGLHHALGQPRGTRPAGVGNGVGSPAKAEELAREAARSDGVSLADPPDQDRSGAVPEDPPGVKLHPCNFSCHLVPLRPAACRGCRSWLLSCG